VACALAGSLCGASEPPKALPLNVVWIAIDALRADHLGTYGYARETSPFLDSLAGSAVLFERAISQESYTQASVPSFFTSTYPRQHGVLYDHPRIDVLAPGSLTIAEILRDHGYATAAFVFNPHLHRKYGFDQGFDLYDDHDEGFSTEGPLYERMETARKIRAKLERHLAGEPRRPIFLYLHYRDVHDPYVPPPPFHARFLPKGIEAVPDLLDVRRFSRRRDVEVFLSQYDGEILYTDGVLRTTFERMSELGLSRENTVFVISADHGEEFREPHPGDPGGNGHGRTLHLEQIHVPLLLLAPGLEQRRIGAWVELTDVTPTLLDLAGIDPQRFPSLEGRSLRALARGEGAARPFVYAGGSNGRATLIADDWKLERFRAVTRTKAKWNMTPAPPGGAFVEQLFHLKSDPSEQKDLLSREPEQAARLRRLLDLHESESAPGRAGSVPLDDEARKQLEALGYL